MISAGFRSGGPAGRQAAGEAPGVQGLPQHDHCEPIPPPGRGAAAGVASLLQLIVPTDVFFVRRSSTVAKLPSHKITAPSLNGIPPPK